MPNDKSAKHSSLVRAKRNGHVQPRAPLIDLDQPGRLRTANVLALAGISHSTLHLRLKTGLFPMPDGRDGGRMWWHTSTIRQFLGG